MSATLKNETGTVTLNSGYTLPFVGLGTWKSANGEVYDAVLEALKTGYRHIDGAAIYMNEEQVGKAIRDSKIPREEIFLTTKLWNTQQRTPQEALDQSLKRLGLDYVDMYLMHWPIPMRPDSVEDGNLLCVPEVNGETDVDTNWDFVKTWELMQELTRTKKVRTVGVSNFSVRNLEELLSSPGTRLVPAVNQVELHPLLPQDELLKYCEGKGIYLEAYSPLGGSDAPVLSNKIIVEVAEKNKIDPGQVVVSWAVQKGVVTLPKSVTPKRIVSNLKTIKLSDEDFDRINNIAKVEGQKRTNFPKWGNFPLFE